MTLAKDKVQYTLFSVRNIYLPIENASQYSPSSNRRFDRYFGRYSHGPNAQTRLVIDHFA